jgi:membrane protein DedA with SNARE-associated domain
MLSGLLSQVLTATSSFNLKIAVILFLLCSIGEIGFALPYILETIWLLAGYQLGTGDLQLIDLLKIWLVAQAGRQTGSLVLYYGAVLGLAPLKKLYKKYVEPRLPKRQFVPAAITKHLTNPNPISIALGRLVGLRIPMALTMGANQKLFKLALGVLISSVIWDGIYIVIGRTVGSVLPKTEFMVLYSIGGLTVVYIAVLVIRHKVSQRQNARKKPVTDI